MNGKLPANKSVAVRPSTYAAIIEITKLPQMLAENGKVRSFTDVMDDVIDFYIEAHQKGKQ